MDNEFETFEVSEGEKPYNEISKPKVHELIKEADEIVKIIASIIVNAK